MKIILLRDQPNLGKRGEVKTVSDGYASNFLIPKGLGQIATPQLLAQVKKEQEEALAKQARELTNLHQLKADLEKRTFVLKVKIGEKGQIFGGVHEKDIAKAVSEKMGVAVEKHQIKIDQVLKDLGVHTVRLKLAGGIEASLKLRLEPQG